MTSFLPAAAIAALLCLILEGPRLGPHYDLLLGWRSSPPLSRELLIINSSVSGQSLGDEILEPEAASSMLYTLTELGANTLIIQVPILGLSTGGTVSEAEIIHRFDEEFTILSRNIRNLFEGIRTGSVAPWDSVRYVGELVELSERGMERLVAALVRRDEEGVFSMERAAAFFGHVRRPGDLLVQLIRAGESGRSGVLAEQNEYSRARPDRDGVLRRIAPVITVPELTNGTATERTLEHIVYGALKPRFRTAAIDYVDPYELTNARLQALGMLPLPVPTKPRQVLFALGGPGDRVIPLDRSGAVLFELPPRGDDFRRINIADFLAYDEADRNYRRLLAEGEALGIFRNIDGENRPGFLYDYALVLRNENEEYRQAWVQYRNLYFASLEDFLYGPAEMHLIMANEELIARNETAQLLEVRDALIRIFALLRAEYEELLQLRTRLEYALASSFCILGNTVDAEASALLANSILTGRVIRPGEETHLFLAALLSTLLICLFIKSLNPAPALGVGILLVLLSAAVFSLSFILTGVWLDPMVPITAGIVAVICSFVWARIFARRYERQFRLAYGPAVSRSCLRSLIRSGKPLPSQVLTVRTAVVAIKNSDPRAQGNSDASTQAHLAFQKRVSDTFRRGGGTVTGSDADVLTVCFGSPLERESLAGKKRSSPYENTIYAKSAPALAAVDLVSEIARRPEYKTWQFGLDIGNCSFAWTALSGYFSLGPAVQKAKVLSRLTSRYNSRIILSSAAREALPELAVKKLDVIKAKDNGAAEPFYRLAANVG
ncbi:MAG: hypothetical protein FWH19_02515 [Treponema sp.]|nr:hypothetical protein [Treponema sp.]